jgi:hypothetical protein
MLSRDIATVQWRVRGALRSVTYSPPAALRGCPTLRAPWRFHGRDCRADGCGDGTGRGYGISPNIVAGVQLVRGRLAGMEVRRRGPVRPGLLADRERLQVVAIALDRGGRVNPDRRVTGKDRHSIVDDVAEEYDLGEPERGSGRHRA